jgi:IS1 family transposase
MSGLVSGDLRKTSRVWLALVSLCALSVAYRIPVFLHARGLNSDVAVVGLQALHLGELDPFLWGSGYQSAADSLVARFVFLLLGPTPLALVLSAFVLHVLVTFLVFTILRLQVRSSLAWALTLPLVFASASVHAYALNPPREASIALVFVALALGTSKPERTPPIWRTALALGVLGLSLAADPYARLMFPPALLWIVLFARRSRVGLAGRLLTFVGALALGVIPEILLRASPRATGGPMSFDLARIPANARLLSETCGPWALGAISYAPKHVMDYERFVHSSGIATLQAAGLFSYACLVIISTLALLRTPTAARIVSGVGLLTLLLSVLGFLVSVMVFDHFAMRYLATLTLFAPFAFVSASRVLPRPLILFLVFLHVTATGISGWTAFRPYVDGAHVVNAPLGARPEEEAALWNALERANIRYAMADYWASYRLTFLARERTIVVPTHAREDRYAPYRIAFERQTRVAYIHDRYRSRESLSDARVFAAAQGTVTAEHALGPFTVLEVERSRREDNLR